MKGRAAVCDCGIPWTFHLLFSLTAVIKPLLPKFLGRAIVILNFVRRFRNVIADTVPL